MRFGILKSNGESLWPDLWPVEEIISDYEDYLQENQVATWFAEMMNYPMPPSGGVIRVDEILFVPGIEPSDPYMHGFATIDLAISQKEWAHNTIIAIHVFDGKHWVIAETVKTKTNDPIKLFWTLVSLSKKWKINYFGIESVAYQQVLMPIYEYFCKTNNIHNMHFIPCPARLSKAERITAWGGLLRNKTYALTIRSQELLNQLLSYDPTSNSNEDDFPDACAHGPHMIRKYGAKIARGFVEDYKMDNYIYDNQSDVKNFAATVRY